MRVCILSDCGRKHHARGLCQKHYDYYYKRHRYAFDRPKCLIEGCKNLQTSKHGMCDKHRREYRKGIVK